MRSAVAKDRPLDKLPLKGWLRKSTEDRRNGQRGMKKIRLNQPAKKTACLNKREQGEQCQYRKVPQEEV